MQLLADRFAIDDRGHAIDLATGLRVCVTASSAGGPTDQARWAERCAWFAALVHPSIAQLVDYGAVGDTQRFEAWVAQAGWPGATAAGQQCLTTANRFLTANRRGQVQSSSAIATVGGRPVVVPDGGAGVLCDDVASAPIAVTRDLLGTIRTPDRRVALIAELFNAPPSQRTVALACWAPEGGGVDLAVRCLARAARLAGFVPVSAALFDPAVRTLVRGRSLLLLADDDVERGWRALVDASLDAPKPHVALFAGHRAVPRVHMIPLERWTPDALVQTVCPDGARHAHLRHVMAAARRSGGLRGRFEQLLFGKALPVAAARSRVGWRAAEPLATFDIEPAEAIPACAIAREWPAPGELKRLRRQVTSARALLAAGRHEPGTRMMRSAVAALARRGDWSSAADGALTLAEALARRGRLAHAEQVLDSARPWASQAHDLAMLQRLAIVRATVWTESGRLAEAEGLLESTIASALSAGTGMLHAATLALVRCLHWQGRFGNAWQRLAMLVPDVDTSDGDAVRVAIARAHVAIGQGRVADGVAEAARARDRATETGDADLLAAALHMCAVAQLAAGDATQADRTAASAIAQARRGRNPLLGISVRILRAEIARRHGRRGAATVVLGRLSRVPSAQLPLTLRAQIDLLRDLLSGADPHTAADRRADVTGLSALRLLIAGREPAPDGHTLAADDIVELLRCCQAAVEDVAVLAAVCASLRARLNASGAGFFVFDRSEPASVATDGARIDPQIARRVRSAGQLVMPHQGGDRPESGVPARYAGQLVGVLVVIWPATAPWHAGDVAMLLSTGAAASGPALSGVLARRADEQRCRTAELIGLSPAIGVVRTAIEKAAAAPYSVLVEGESGSGKELVARLLHTLGPRRDRTFCTLNCAALPDELIESELFGHARGAFTGALGERRGVFEEAHGGTLFLDEIGELSPRAQAKLLRAIQEGEIRRVGENVCRRVDVRLIAATNRNLREEVARRAFRMDLLYRLDVIRIALPSLRERREDIAVLADHFWRDATTRLSSRATLSAAVVVALTRYDWPGNIRELQNVLASLAVRSPRRGVVAPSALPSQFDGAPAAAEYRLDLARQTFERSFIRAALVRAGGQRSRAAQELGITRQGLAKLMTRLTIEDGCAGVTGAEVTR